MLGDHAVLYLWLIIGLALVFDFLNGFHDAANSIATVVSTRVLTPGFAVVWAGFFNFIAVFLLGVAVAKTVGKGIIVTEAVSNHVLLAALVGAISWNLLTWWLGLPTSSSHALIGGLVGGAVAAKGVGSVVVPGLLKVSAFIVIAPLFGLFLAWLNTIAASWIFRRALPGKVDQLFRRLQLVSAALYSLGHGGNDAQKTMGIIALLLYSSGRIDHFYVPGWVAVVCGLAIGLGTMSGGWRIVHTLGSRITALRPFGGFCAETAGATSLFIATHLGIPVSTTHTITGAIVGVGATRRLSAVRWGVAGRIVWAWVLTIPASAIVAALTYLIASRLLPE
ncbi:MAG TPA: inorganic phosphate transporter [Candidatus Eisenbacteria bacterium]|nr:inorganic phosphate transporter [Candidatus Eisenbacteria bacterium]HEU4333805.1 inorganic phosphate transporter [Candidatus Eisenbacteria bacterium]